jgi:hypothetical protein
MGGIVSALYGAIACRVFCGITLHAVAPLFYKGDRHPNRPVFFSHCSAINIVAIAGSYGCSFSRPGGLADDRTAPGSVDAADRIPAGPSRTTYQWALGD